MSRRIRALAFSLLLASAGASCTDAVRAPSPSPTAPASVDPSATAVATASPTSIATTSSPAAALTFENPILGYRISLPAAYRRTASVTFDARARAEILGRDVFTLQTEQEEREACLRDLGDIPPASAALGLFVEVYPIVAGVSAAEWVSTPRVTGGQPMSTHRRVEALTINGRDAVRLIADNATADLHLVAIRVDDRIFVITPHMWPSPHRLDAIAAGFATVARQPFPTPTPTLSTTARRQAATDAAAALSRAFAARDAGAVGSLMVQCHVGVSPLIDGQSLANSGGGGLSRSVPSFIQGLRDRFASGTLSVSVQTMVVRQEGGGAESYAIPSEWRETDRTTRVDLVLGERDGRWLWVAAVHHYARSDLISGNCIPYRSPWVSAGSC